jgi:DNA-directed RNA polymerase II subunit RPB1
MGHRAKVLDWSTFRLNLSVTTPYNADFDGDEMNLHVPQSIVARADAHELMMVARNIVTPQSNRNVMGIVQDALLSLCNMTKRGVMLEKDTIMNIMIWMPSWNGVLPTPAILKPRQLWTGKQIFSLVMPKVNYSGTSMCSPPKGVSNPLNLYDCETLILNGELIQGVIDKAIVGAKAGSIVHMTWLDLGWEETRRFMNEVQMVANAYMVNRSYTVGVADTVADESTMNEIHAALAEAKENVSKTMTKAQSGKLEGQAGKSISEKFEMTVNALLNQCINKAGQASLSSLKERNAIKGTVNAGSKGSSNNISQIIACVGQQNVQGARVKYGFNQRTMPHFSKDDLGMESRGFVENSYLRGLSASEFYFHAMGGREGCIDTAVKTSETGYIQRRLVKAMETVMARYDGTMRNAAGCVMQFLYGQDGLDAQRMEKQQLDTYLLPMKKFKAKMYINYAGYGGEPEDLEYLSAAVQDDIQENMNDIQDSMEREFEQLNVDRAEMRYSLAGRYSSNNEPMEMENKVHLPVNIDRLIWNSQRQFGCGDTRFATDLHPNTVQAAVKEINAECIIVKGDDRLSVEAQHNATILWKALIRSKLATKRVLKTLRLNEMALTFIKGEIVRCFHKTIVSPGEMCGVLAAQSLGEPATQMTLNTFHSTGISAKNVTLGVPRLNEILNIAKQPKTPSLTVHVRGDDAYDEEAVNEVMEQLEYTVLGDMMAKAEIHYDPDPLGTVIEEDKEFVGMYFQIPDEDFNPDSMSPWVLRLLLDRENFDMRSKFLRLDDIAKKVREFFKDGVHVICSDENCDDNLVIRLRIIVSEEDRMVEEADVANGASDDEFLRRMMLELMGKLRLCGINGIDKSYTAKRKRAVWSDEIGFTEVEEHIIETNGSNLAETLAVVAVDHTRTMSNDIVEMFQVLGIEGARSSLFHELSAILCFDNGYVNVRHITTLCDCMTFSGYLMAVSRHGINKSDVGPLLRASFEETVDIFMGAAMYSQFDHLDGVTQNVMLGQLAKVGTGTMDLLVDTDKLQEAIDYDHGLVMGGAQVGAGGEISKMTPYQASPVGFMGNETAYAGFTPDLGTPMSMYTPAMQSPGASSPLYAASPGAGASSPLYGSSPNAQSPMYAASPAYSPTSPMYSPQSPAFSPTSPSYSPTSPAMQYSPNSPAASPTSPAYSPTSPAWSPTSPAFSPSTPQPDN